VGELLLGVVVLALVAGGGIVVIDALIIGKIRKMATRKDDPNDE
jgi:hypothetical protein